MFYVLLDFEANIQGMAEVDEHITVYITLEALLQRFESCQFNLCAFPPLYLPIISLVTCML